MELHQHTFLVLRPRHREIVADMLDCCQAEPTDNKAAVVSLETESGVALLLLRLLKGLSLGLNKTGDGRGSGRGRGRRTGNPNPLVLGSLLEVPRLELGRAILRTALVPL